MPSIDPVIESLIKRMRERSALGMVTYGTSLADNPEGMIFWINSAIEELLDAAAYLERLKMELGKETASLDQ